MKKWIIITLCVLFLLGIGIVFAIIQSNNETKGTEMKEETELASNETNTTNTIETLARETKISPNAKIIKKEYYKSEIGLKILDLIEYFEPDFYTELHCYDLAHFDRLTSMERYTKTGIPPLIDLGNHVLVSSVSPLIRMTYFSTDTVCKTLEFPCVEKLSAEKEEKYNFNKKSAVETYEKLLNLIVRAPNREYFEKEMLKNYYNQVALAVDYAKKVFGPEFPPY